MRRDFEWTHETVLAAETASASRARDFVCLHLIEHELLYLVEDVRLVVSELATHAVLEGRLPFLVKLQGSDESVLLTVHDGSRGTPGEGEDPVDAQVDAQVDARDHRLAVVESASREWGVRREPDGTRSVWASFEVRWRRSPD